MQNKLQELTDKIYKEGLAKGTEEANHLLDKAKKEAADILSKARKEADEIVSQAKKQSDELKKNVETEINLSTRQVFTGLKQEIAAMIETKVIEGSVADAMKDTAFVKSVIETAIAKWEPTSADRLSLSVLIPANMEKELASFTSKKMAATLNKEVELVVDRTLKFGFKIGPKDGGYYISFTDKDFENLFKEYMRPRIVNMLFGGK